MCARPNTVGRANLCWRNMLVMPGCDAGEVLPGFFRTSVAAGADTNAHARSAKADTAAAIFVVTPTLDITLARSVSV